MSNPSVGDAEPTLVGKLRQIADAKLGDPIPECLAVNNTWGTALSQLAGEAADALDQRWRPKETFPQPPAPIGDDKQCRVRVLIQDEADNVFEGTCATMWTRCSTAKRPTWCAGTLPSIRVAVRNTGCPCPRLASLPVAAATVPAIEPC